MRAIWIALPFAALAACSSTPSQDEQPPAGVEDRRPGAKPSAQPQPVKQPPVAAVDLTAGKRAALSALTDPASILSRRSIYYEFDKYDIKDEYKSLVEAHARYLRDNPRAKMLIQGNSDERGSREYNLGLGERRGNSVSSAVQANGGSGSQIMVTSYGEERPTCTQSNEDCWARNRRVEIIYTAQ